MIDAADPRRRHVDLARIGLGISNELRDGLGRNGWIDHHDGRNADDAGNGRDVADEIEIEVVVKCRVDCVRLGDPKQRVAVGRGVHDRVGGDIGAGAGAVFDNELLAEPLRQPLAHEPRHDVGRSAGGKPTKMWTGRAGKDSALTVRASAGHAAIVAANFRNFLRTTTMAIPSKTRVPYGVLASSGITAVGAATPDFAG